MKQFFDGGLARRLMSFLIGRYVRLVDATTRWTIIGRGRAAALLDGDRGFIVAVWHQRLMMASALRRETPKRVFMLVSSHRDGEIMANALKGYRIEYIRGSSANPKKRFKNKRGVSAVSSMRTALDEGHIVCVAPDGPRGPGRQTQSGLIRLAQLSGAPIIPSANAVSRGRFLNTWDRFFLPLPFARGCFALGAPIEAPRNASPDAIEAARVQLENALNEITAEADAFVKRSPDQSAIG
ncbi:MAG: lysophospholipid acyltransferase family protein [Amphiplicatus sp.]